MSYWMGPTCFRTGMTVQGRIRTFDCRATRVSPFRMMVEAPVVGKVGDSFTSYFRDFGNLEGTISETTTRGLLA